MYKYFPCAVVPFSFCQNLTALAVANADNMPPTPLFSLFPMNDGARKCIEDPANAHLIHTRSDDSRAGILVDFRTASKTPGCIISFGKEGDVCVSGSRISGMQCQFILNETTHEIILRDRSAFQSTLLTNSLTSKQLLRGVPANV